MKTLPALLILVATVCCAQEPATPAPKRSTPQKTQQNNSPASDVANGSYSLPEVLVTSETPYNATEAATATKFDVPLKDLPASVKVIPGQVLQDRGVTQINQIADTVSGLHAESSYGANRGTFFNIRGFSTANSLRDGFRAEGNLATRDVQDIDSIEVLKGPAGALYTSMESLGGFINTVSKRPQDTRFGEMGITFGSFGLVRPTLDFNTPLTPGGSLLGRLNASYEYNDTFRDFSSYHSFSIAPALEWKIDSDTKLTFLGEYDNLHENHFDFGVFSDPQTLGLSRRIYYGLPQYDFGRNETYSTTLLFEHKFGSDWIWRESANFTQAKQRTGQTFPFALTGPDNVSVALSVPEATYDHTLQSDLEGKFNTGPIKHTVLFGADLASYERGGSNFSQGLASENLLNLTYPRVDPSTVTYFDAYNNTINDLGLYLQDLIDLGDHVKLFGGIRPDWYDSKLTPHFRGDTGFHNHFFELSGRAGIVYHPVKDTSLYFSWGRSAVTVAQSAFNPPGVPISNSGFEPEISEQFEAGVKQDFLGGRLSATLAGYQITRSHVLTQDPSNPLKQIQTGEERSRGIDFDVTGQIVPGWNVIATYAYCDAKVTKDNTIPVGDRLPNAPLNSASLWTTYRIQAGKFRGCGIGFGEVFVGDREATLPNTFNLGGYWRTDAALYYERDHWKAQVNFANIFDTRYFTGGTTGTFNQFVEPGQPFSVQATITYKF